AAARDEKEGLIADLEHDARSRTGNSAEAGMELPPAAVLGRESEAGRGLDLALGRDSDRARQGLATRAAVDLRPRTPGEDAVAVRRCRRTQKNQQCEEPRTHVTRR